MAWRFHGRARVSASAPQAFGRCDRCGIWYNRVDLVPETEWFGNELRPTGQIVCTRTCEDEPFPFYRPVILPPDPLPVLNPRPENFTLAETDYRVTADGDRRITEAGDPRITQPDGDDMMGTLYG